VSSSASLRSDLKQLIIISLLDGAKKISEFKVGVVARETSILHILKEFETLNLTAKSAGTYRLTSLGVMEAQICREYRSATEVIESFSDFWLTHNVTGIPPRFINRIGALKDAKIIKSAGMDLHKVHENFMNMLISSKKVRGISPIFHPDYISTFEHLLSQGCTIDLIVTNDVLAKTMAVAEAEALQGYLAQGKIRVFLNDDLRFALTVTENSLSLGLFNLAGDYDYSNDLVCVGKEGVEWGNQLFESTLKTSTNLFDQQ